MIIAMLELLMGLETRIELSLLEKLDFDHDRRFNLQIARVICLLSAVWHVNTKAPPRNVEKSREWRFFCLITDVKG